MADDKISNRIKIGIRPAGGLHARLANAELLKETLPQLDSKSLPNRLVLMLDCSGSMAGESIRNLESASQNFIMQLNPDSTALALEAFPEGLHVDLSTDKGMLMLLATGLKAEGGTPLADCLRRMSKSDLTRGIIISDGEPTDMYRGWDSDVGIDDKDRTDYSTLNSYIEKKTPLDTIHIGIGTQGEKVLQEIARRTGGTFLKFKDIKTLISKLHFLLPEQRHVLGLPEAKEILGADDLR
jgi:uncharacterized protein YegL